MNTRFKPSRQKAFTLIEIVITLVIISILTIAGVVSYKSFIDKSKSAEALIDGSLVAKGEFEEKHEKGRYLAANNTDEINLLLGLSLKPKYYEYKVVGVTDDNFIFIAKRIGEDINAFLNAGKLPPQSTVIAWNNAGTMSSGYGQYLQGWDTGPAGGTGGGVTTGGGGTGGGSGGSSGGGITGGGGSGGGSTGGGGTTGGSGGGTGGGTTVTTYSAPTYDTSIKAALDILIASATGNYFAGLILDKAITVIYEALDSSIGANWTSADNTIRVNETERTSPPGAVAALICHEATHADYSYYSEKWILYTLAQHPGITRDQIHITKYPYDSIDQEYNCFVNQMLVWKENKGNDKDSNNDGWQYYYDQGEAVLRAEVRTEYDKLYTQLKRPLLPDY